MNLHLIGFPHTETIESYSTCAYTAKARKAARMFTDAGHTVYLYSGERNDAPCEEHIPLISAKERLRWFGGWNPEKMPDVNWSPDAPHWRTFNRRAIEAISERADAKDPILCSMGWSQKQIADEFPDLMPVEYGVGYEGICLNWRAFESSAWMHHVYGIKGIRDGQNFDAVIPNFFDPSEFMLGSGSDDYLLFLGRVTPRKGVKEAIEIAKASGLRLIVAGPKDSSRGAVDEVDLGGCEYVGAVGPLDRALLLAGARALVAPTLYLEPFGGVVVEAFMAGTPAITTDWGAFRETNQQGVTVYRIRTLQEGVDAAHACLELDRQAIRDYAVANYSLESVAPQYEAWFARLDTLWRNGWYQLREEATL